MISVVLVERTEMIQFSDYYNAQTIFDQVWESPYEWFRLANGTTLPTVVDEIDDNGDILSSEIIDVKDIEEAVFKYYNEIVSKRTGTWATNLSDFLQDLDANDVDCILQYAMFGSIRYS